MDIKESTFENYLQCDFEPLTFEEMKTIHQEIITNADVKEEDFKDCWEEMIRNAIQYSEDRANWNFMSIEEKLDRDASRSAKHNLLIGDFIILERIFKINGWNSQTWTKLLFLKEEKENRTSADVTEYRKRIGDFANYLVFVYMISAR